jgi:hypothetical protein
MFDVAFLLNIHVVLSNKGRKYKSNSLTLYK